MLAQALVGIAFAVGFIIGPMTGAAFSVWGVDSQQDNWWFWAAIFALTLAVINILFVSVLFKESLPEVYIHTTRISCIDCDHFLTHL